MELPDLNGISKALVIQCFLKTCCLHIRIHDEFSFIHDVEDAGYTILSFIVSGMNYVASALEKSLLHIFEDDGKPMITIGTCGHDAEILEDFEPVVNALVNTMGRPGTKVLIVNYDRFCSHASPDQYS